MNIGAAFTEAMQAQRDRDHDHVTYSDYYRTVMVERGTEVDRRKVWLTIAEAAGEAAREAA